MTRAVTAQHQPAVVDKHREDLSDAALAAWTALLWSLNGFLRCQVFGCKPAGGALAASLISPARPSNDRD